MNTTQKPLFQEFNIEGVDHISPDDAVEALQENDTVMIDVREVCEVDAERIPIDNILYHPMSVIVDRLQQIEKNQHIIVVCMEGVRSTKVANLLKFQGYKNVANLDGGLIRWKESGLPTIRPGVSDGGCGCGCGC
ncbi:MAG: rhodanese-like domain-containing protein [Bacteroidales bacterium]